MREDTELIGSSGLNHVGAIFNDELGWIFRRQPEHDWGIDAIVEQKSHGKATGVLVAAQVKSGISYFNRPSPRGGWTLYGPKRHLEYWLGYALPVIVVLYDPRNREAYWVHVNTETAHFTADGYAIDIPADQKLTSTSARQLVHIAERWVPRRDVRTRILAGIAQSLSYGIPVHPTAEMFDRVTGKPDAYVPIKSWFDPHVTVCNLDLSGDALASGFRPGLNRIRLDQLRGTWWVPSGTEVYVFENPGMLQAVGAALGSACPPLVCLDGFPGQGAEYLLLGLGACAAQVRVHTDHDEVGGRIAATLFHRIFNYQVWCPRASLTMDAEPTRGHEELCLVDVISALSSVV